MVDGEVREMMRRIFYVDYSFCIGCEMCEGVCDFIYGGRFNIKVYYIIIGIFVFINCCYCEKVLCMDVCFVGVIYCDSDGVVIINFNKCIGCLMCFVVCFFGVFIFDVKFKVVIKCDMCVDRRRFGMVLVCVEMCLVGVIFFGKFEEVEEKVRRRIVEKIVWEWLVVVNLEGVGWMF